MKRRSWINLALIGVISLTSACSLQSWEPGLSFSQTSFSQAETSAKATSTPFLASGTIILSHSIPERGVFETALVQNQPDTAVSDEVRVFAPLIGYFPPAHAYIPADNETWLQIERDAKKITLFKGSTPIKTIVGEGEVSIGSGDYYLQHKQKQPLWYATDQYFERRKLAIPEPGDRLRYRRGALGKYALYPTTTFPIHCGPVWSEDVGGLRIASSELSSIYYMLPVGAPIVVK